nr:surfeit locus protein 6 homolog [Ziziphus jujuba var. spinosa]
MKMKMKKKKETPATDSNPILDLKSIIHEHSLFFDKLVELIPARFYLPNDDEEKPWFQGLSKAKKASAKKESKENIKKARRDRMDPEKSSTTTLDLLKQSLKKEKSNNGSDDDDDDTEVKPIKFEGDDRSLTYEELRQRLHRKLEQFRASRNSGDPDKKHEKNEKRGAHQKKRKRDTGSGDMTPTSGNQVNKVEKDVEEASKELTFSHVKLGNEDGPGKKKRKLSKAKELEKARKLDEAKKDPKKGETISWKTAASRAAGIKVHDDPKLLNKSIRKEKKRHQKNAEKWKGRVENTGKMKAEKQKKRSENLAQRIHDKKMRRIAKREKKLMRPGFEGRKEGFINEEASA